MRIPTFQQLTSEQLTIINLPLDKNWVVTGPPGTGKTILALWRIKELDDRTEDISFIVFNAVLRDYAQSALGEEANEELFLKNSDPQKIVKTYHKTIFDLWRIYVGGSSRPPKLGDSIHFDWPELLNHFVSQNIEIAENIIVDEGQDLPRDFYLFIRTLGSRVTIFLDPHQTIEDQTEHATLNDIKHYIEAPDSYQVTLNHRNSLPIAKLSHYFFTGTHEQLPKLPDSESREHQDPNYASKKPELISVSNVEASIERIASHARNYAEDSIVIIAQNTRAAEKYYDLLAWHTDAEIHRQYRRYEYDSGRGRKVQLPLETANFGELENGGIMITTTASMKGLEFDAVFVLETDDPGWKSKLEQTRGKELFYVMVTRARETLQFHYCGKPEDPPVIFSDIPDDLLHKPNNGTGRTYTHGMPPTPPTYDPNDEPF